LKKEYRIKKSAEIQDIIHNRVTIGNSYFVIYYMKNHDHNTFRYALSVPKKYGNAVKRNLMKRRIREVIKVNDFKDDYDFFIVAKIKSNALRFEKIKRILEKLFAKADILGEKKI